MGIIGRVDGEDRLRKLYSGDQHGAAVAVLNARVDYIISLMAQAMASIGNREIFVGARECCEAPPDGSYVRPYHSINDAIQRIIDKGDNSVDNQYIIKVLPGNYNDEVVLDSDKLTYISIIGVAPKHIDPGIRISKLTCKSNNDNFQKLMIEGLCIGSVEIEGASDNTSAFAWNLVFNKCLIETTTSIKNTITTNLVGCKIGGNITFENVYVARIDEEPGHNPGSTLTVRCDSTKKKSYLGAYCQVVLHSTITGSFNIQRVGSTGVAYIQARAGTRIAHPSATSTIGENAIFRSYGSYVRGNIINEGDAEFDMVEGNLTNNNTAKILSCYGDISGTGTTSFRLKTSQISNTSEFKGETLDDVLNSLAE